MRALTAIALLLALSLSSACSKPNPHDNIREPEPHSDKPVQNHRFDGGESDPYFKPGEQGGGDGGDKATGE